MLCCTMHRENVGEQREKEGVLRLSESGTCMVVRTQATVGCLIRIVMLSADGRALGSNPKFDKIGRVRGRSLIHTKYIKIIVQSTNTKDVCYEYKANLRLRNLPYTGSKPSP